MKDNTKEHTVWTTESSFSSLVEKDVKNTLTQTTNPETKPTLCDSKQTLT